MAKYSNLEKVRLEKLKKLREEGIEPYPGRVERTHTIQGAKEEFLTAEEDGVAEEIQVVLAGRIRSMRPMGKITFADIEDGTGRIQLFFRANDIGEERVKFFDDRFDLGDFIQAGGKIFRTRTEEITVWIAEFKMLAKAITPLPAAKDEVVDGEVVQHATLSDPETRYRQRYADLAVNPEVRKTFRTRTQIIRALQTFLDARGFLEVETPVLQPIYGGAAAQPFVTHHNQLKQNLYLRISFELYLKRLLVGGFERVYEIGRDFRNEGVSFKHNPEFTQLEFYQAYADYRDVMELTEQMLVFVGEQVLGTRKFTYQGEEIDLSPPWKRVELRQGLLDATGIDISEHDSANSLAEAMKGLDVEFDPTASRGKLIDDLLGHYLEPSFIQPTFLYDYPREISPLAKSTPGDPSTVERFEGFMGGMELCNAFTELNDPLDQEKRFLEMGRSYAKDEDEHHPLDEDYLRAMRYGMPPNGGFGMGVDRLVMLLTDQPTIREVLLFPHLREE
ncbi:MAG: lysine--tRNA ligase [Anaerolineales bacterium]|nr:lysine--tRNA ligase [Anaerolineales bacterium]